MARFLITLSRGIICSLEILASIGRKQFPDQPKSCVFPCVIECILTEGAATGRSASARRLVALLLRGICRHIEAHVLSN